MTLCLYGSQDLSTLHKWAYQYFEGIINKKVSNPSLAWWGKIPPFAPQVYASVIEVSVWCMYIYDISY